MASAQDGPSARVIVAALHHQRTGRPWVQLRPNARSCSTLQLARWAAARLRHHAARTTIASTSFGLFDSGILPSSEPSSR